MEYAIAALILVALGFLYYGWIRLRQEAEAKARRCQWVVAMSSLNASVGVR